MKKQIVVVFSSHLSDDENTKFIEHVNDTIGVKHEVYAYPNFNQFSLPEVYNRAIDEHHANDAVMVFCHNDIIFETKDWGKKILNHFNKTDYQIIGVAGATELHKHGCWWLNENRNGMNFSKMIGIVNHANILNGKIISTYSSNYSSPHVGVKPTILVDGLFIAVDTADIEARFDESYEGFHFYDISFCIPNYLAGCNIGVITDVRITHKSPGATNQEWEKNRLQFAEQYAAELPIQIEL